MQCKCSSDAVSSGDDSGQVEAEGFLGRGSELPSHQLRSVKFQEYVQVYTR